MITVTSDKKFSIPCSSCNAEIVYTRRSYANKRLQEHAECFTCRTVPKEKICIFCKVSKPILEFPNRTGKQKHLFDSRCKECKKIENTTWRKDNLDKVLEYREKDKWNLKKRCARRNITEKEFLNKLDEQKHLCKICETSICISDSAIDHNHETGYFRGILCKTCNRALGLFKDSPKVLESALDYLMLEGYYGKD